MNWKQVLIGVNVIFWQICSMYIWCALVLNRWKLIIEKNQTFHVPSSTKKSSMCIGAYSPTHFPVFSQWWKCRLKVGRVPAAISARINSVQGPSGEGHEHRGEKELCDSF